MAVPLAGLLAAVLARKTVAGVEGWRMMLFVPIVGAALIWLVRRGLPESPRWLAEHGRLQEADNILKDIEEIIFRRTGQPLTSPVYTTAPLLSFHGEFIELFRGELLRRTLMM